MIIYPDTSFLFSLWHADDVNYACAEKFFYDHESATWLWCDLHEMEFPIAVQMATHLGKNPLAEHIARAVIFRAERAVRRGFVRRELPHDAKKFALALAGRYGWQKKLTTLDLWHVGAAFELGCDTFATFDGRQAEIARKAGLATSSSVREKK